ncbi:MAG: hypothetical protein HY819_09970 [Acidobacteria bacterium]|nr:hypothetical protein [Acidobacteriota bacterium]
MKNSLKILVIDSKEELKEFINLVKKLPLKIELFIAKDLFSSQLIIKENDLSSIFFSITNKQECLELVSKLNDYNKSKLITIVDDASLGKELNNTVGTTYLLKEFLNNEKLVEQIIENSNNNSLLNNLKATILAYEKNIEKINEEYNFFAYVVSHDLHAPLRAIRNISEWIEEDLGDSISPETKQNIKLLRGRVKRLEALINGVLEYSRIQRIKSPIELVDVNDLLVEVLDLIDKPKDFSFYTQTLPEFNTSREKLKQLFFHLIKNAVDFRSSDNGFVKISANEEKDFYLFAVTDNGQGIAPEYHKRIFEIFQTLSPRDKVERVGIGLTLVKKIIESVGGNIKLESNLGQGSTFYFWWPK